jgi:glycosyltransferase involved in cell wall biosynthesis
MKNEEAPTIDVLLATFNSEKYIDEFMDSLKNQIEVPWLSIRKFNYSLKMPVKLYMQSQIKIVLKGF